MDQEKAPITKTGSPVVVTALQYAAEENQRRGPPQPCLPSSAPSVPWRSAVAQVGASCAALSLALHAGVNMAMTAIMIPQMEEPDSVIRVDRDSASWIAAVVAVTTPVGSLASGPLMDWAGRRAACLLTAAPLVAAWLLLALAAGPWPVIGVVYASRALAGVGSGLSTAAGVYVSEVAHPSLRPALLCLNSVFVAAGILMTASLGMALHWGWVALVFAATAAASALALLLLCPESPHWLLNMAPGRQMEQRSALARAALDRLNRDGHVMEEAWERLVDGAAPARRPGNASTARASSEAEDKHLLGRRTFRTAAVFLRPTTAKPMLILSVIFVVQQLSGTYVIIFYAVPLFAKIGSRIGTTLDEFSVMVIMSAVRFAMSVVTVLLSRSFGRRSMLICSGLGMAASSAVTGATLVTAPAALGPGAANVTDSVLASGEVFEASWTPLVFVVIFVLFSSLGYLVMPWTLVSELLPLASRGMGSGLLVSLAYLLMFGVVKSFPYLMASVGARNVFYMFGSVACAGTAFVFFYLPETLGRSLEEIEAAFKKSEDLEPEPRPSVPPRRS